MTLTESQKELYASSGTDIELHTLQINHASWDNSFYIVSDFQDLSANLEDDGPLITFQKYAFSIDGPNKNENGNISLNIKIDAVNQELITLIESAILDENNNTIEVTYRQYLNSDTSGPQNDPPLVLYMKTVQVTNTQISGQATLLNLMNKKFPSVLYDNKFKNLSKGQ